MRHSSIPILLATTGLAGVLAGCGQSDPAPGCGKLAVHDAWVAPAYTGSREMLGYFTLYNDGSKPVTVNGVSSDAFDRAVFQNKAAAAESSNDAGGDAQPLARITVAAGEDVRFEPGRREVALYSPSRAYRAGDRIRLSLICGRRHAALATTATVRDRHGDLPSVNDDRDAAERRQVIRGGRNSGGANDDSKTAN
ncbi:copper chaperone PCu(A)C [Salinisphaera sp.]|uniref:copper chaperone PCu(A)C n=1 Tax=Salinisphaera sp. TaxID=1914330 RepID=UPI002D79D786|nr:copper chaperone PCu(A)C [Salinisphaera sp.]HET7312930.1 copper chaperone PCu(A)C [Salinisphaera sp.]